MPSPRHMTTEDGALRATASTSVTGTARRGHALLLAAMVCAGCSGANNRLGTAPLASGQQLRVTDTVDLAFSLEMDQGPLKGNAIDLKNRVDAVITVAFRESDEAGATELGLTVGEANIAVGFSLMGVEKSDPAPFANKSYTATRTDSGYAITRADGTDARPEEAEFLSNRAAAFARGSLIKPCIPDGPLEVGLRVDDLTPCRGAVVRDEKFALEKGHLVLTELSEHEGRSAAHFDLEMGLLARSGGGGTVKTPSLYLDVTGKLVVDLETGRNLLLTIEGPVKSGDDGGGTKVSGTFSMSERTAFLPRS